VRIRLILTALLTSAFLATNVPISLAVEKDDGGYGGSAGYSNTGLKTAVWARDPETGDIVPAPPGHVSQDPNQYRADLQCQADDNNIDINCLAGQQQCPPREVDGKAGTPVIWKVAPRSIPDPVWTDWTPNGNGPSCLYDQSPEDLLPRIAARILNDFRNLPIKAADVTSQPSPHTLRGAETNIFASATEQQFDVTILGQRVHIIATPAEYTYNYGDGSSLGPTPVAGGPIPQSEWGQKTRTSHVYQQTGDFQISVTTHFQGTYSVNGGPPLPIPGQGEFTAPPQTISVWRSVTRNYADDCLRNPQGEGCPGVPAP
jgi:hypothetical protein